MPRDSGRVRGSKAEDEEYVLVVKDVINALSLPD